MDRTRLVLWDIDHTLIETGGVGGEAFRAAFELTTGQPMREQADPTGQTEPTIFRRTLEAHGFKDPDGSLFERFATAQADAYRERADDLRRRGRVLPGVRTILKACAAEPHIAQSVLSGNTRQASRVKLDIFDLLTYLDLDIGAYGDNEPERPKLVPHALALAAAKLGRPIGPTDTILIGDTPADIETAHANGCPVIAVATGRTSADELAALGAEWVFPNLLDLVGVLAAIHA
jgi:phosphoglycolate phosphatase-like HAD superfamily hydrolase